MNPGKLYFIPQLFKPPTKEYSAVSQNDPFVAHEVLQEYCSLFASDGSGVPSYISRDPDISSIIDFPAESWDKIAKVQMQREKIETKAEDKEATTAPKQQEVDHLKRTLDQTVDRIFNKHGFFCQEAMSCYDPVQVYSEPRRAQGLPPSICQVQDPSAHNRC